MNRGGDNLILLISLNFQSKGEMNDLTAWILICHRLEIRDVVSLFKTCRLLVELSAKSGLWRFLMRRDYPEHHHNMKRSENCDQWYKELHQYGAYFLIHGDTFLYPIKVEYIVPPSNLGMRPPIMTSRKSCEDATFSCLRFPGQMFVRLEDYKVESPFVMEEESWLAFGGRELRFGRGKTRGSFKLTERRFGRGETNCALELEKFDCAKWNLVVRWILMRFETEKIVCADDEIRFSGKLHHGFTVEADDDYYEEHNIFTHMETLCDTICDYYLTNISRSDDTGRMELYCSETQTTYLSIGDEPPPRF